MQDNNDPKRTFLNRRDWGSYLGALQSAATYPKVMEAVKSGREWFTEGAAQASNWLAAARNWATSSALTDLEPLRVRIDVAAGFAQEPNQRQT